MMTDHVTPTEAVSTPKVSSTQIAKISFLETRALYLDVLKRSWGWLLVLQIFQLADTQASAYALESLRNSGREDLGLIALIAGGQLIFTLVWSALWVLVISLTASETLVVSTPRPKAPLASVINSILIEQTRVLAAILWRVPFIIPAGIQWVRLTLVPFVVIFDPEYTSGERDALETSRALSYRHFWLLNWYLIISSVLTWAVEWAVQGDAQWVWESPVRVLMSSALSLLVSLAAGLFLFSLYLSFRRNLQPDRGSYAHV